VSRNRQSGHVGNLGDIIKHAALVELGSLLIDRGEPVSFVDTHTFRLHSPLAVPVRFHRELAEHVARYPAAARYAELERAHLEGTGDYRCSSGLMLDVLREHRVCAVLGEANGLTRAELKEQIAQEGHANVHVVDDASAVDRGGWVPAGGALLVHVDPFALTPADWAPLAPALDAISARASASAFVIYSYTRAHRTEWPAPPANTTFIAESRSAPHECALYASALVADAARDIGASLGWRLR
jgi:23S rRNA A2030 N6-methylase RlmJ